jgi:5'-nucleotidase
LPGLKFLDEADSINRYVQWLRMTEGIHTFVVLIHHGGRQTTYEGPTQPGGLINGQDIVNIVTRVLTMMWMWWSQAMLTRS